MNPTLRFVVPGIALTKGSVRAFVPISWAKKAIAQNKQPRAVITNDSRRGAAEWQQKISDYAGRALADAKMRPFPDGPVMLDVWFYFPRPQKYQTKKWARVDVPHVTKIDADKALRLVADALSGIVYPDDSRIVDAYVHKRYCAHGAIPRAVITVRAVSCQLPSPVHHPDAPTLFGEEPIYA
jgi:Holliday junction resolvase RusA-like endonuclease